MGTAPSPHASARLPGQQSLVDGIVDAIVSGFDPRAVLAFGSRARGDHHPNSDVDLLIVLDAPGDVEDAEWEIDAALDGLPLEPHLFVIPALDWVRRSRLPRDVVRWAVKDRVVSLYDGCCEQGRIRPWLGYGWAWEELRRLRGALAFRQVGADDACALAARAMPLLLQGALLRQGVDGPNDAGAATLLGRLPSKAFASLEAALPDGGTDAIRAVSEGEVGGWVAAAEASAVAEALAEWVGEGFARQTAAPARHPRRSVPRP